MTQEVLFRGRSVSPSSGIFADRETLATALEGALTWADVLTRLGLRPAGTRYAQLRAAVAKFDLPLPAREELRAGRSRFANEAEVRQVMSSARSVKHALEMFGLSLAKKNYDSLLWACHVYGIQVPERHGGKSWQVKHKELVLAPKRFLLDDLKQVEAAVTVSSTWESAWQCLAGNRRPPTEPQVRALRRLAQTHGYRLAGSSRTSPHFTTKVVEEWLRKPEELNEMLAAATSATDAARRLGLGRGAAGLRSAKELLIARGFAATAEPKSAAKNNASRRHGIEILCADSSATTGSARRVIRREKLLPDVCSVCELGTEWRGRPITLILDHINGDPRDHRIENLRFVCPNCESQLPTTGSRNRKRKNNTNKA